MQELNKWADRVYAENDFGRSISTSISGVIGLITYLIYGRLGFNSTICDNFLSNLQNNIFWTPREIST